MEMVGLIIRRERQKRGWSIGELARRAELDSGYLSRVETGRVRSPGIEQVQRIASALGLSPDRLLGSVPIQPVPAAARRPASLGGVVSGLRRRAGLERDQLARQVRISEEYLSRLEADQVSEPSAQLLVDLARVLGASVYELFATAGYTDALPEFREYVYAKYPQEMDEDLIDMIEGLIERRRQREAERRGHLQGEGPG